MIVRDEGTTLPSCLESVRGLFDEIVVVDTGSTDDTRQIAEDFGARVTEFGWVDDFSAPRNVSLAMATGDYAFWLDADDIVEPQERTNLENVLNGLRVENKSAYRMLCASDRQGDGPLIADHIRLFPMSIDIRWVYRVHEQILPSLERFGVPIRRTGITIRHRGYADPATKDRKRQRDFRILMKELSTAPDDSFVLYNLGMILFERSLWQDSLGYFERSLAFMSYGNSIASFRRKVLGMLAWANQLLGHLDDSLKYCNEGLVSNQQDAELLFRKAVVYRHGGRTSEAEACWRQIISLPRPVDVCSIDSGIYGHLTRRNLAMIAEERGDHAEALTQWQAVLAECPADSDAVLRLGKLEASANAAVQS
jgi:glycosyltransferase involved in cell wall biosynthesis